jgi:hypothetical protein
MFGITERVIYTVITLVGRGGKESLKTRIADY